MRSHARLLLAALALAFVLPLVLAPPATACSCMEQQPLEVYAREPQSAIFSGSVAGRDARGVRVNVDAWFAGQGLAPIVWIAGDFGNGASCGVGSEPAPGSRWLWVAWRPDPGADPVINICQPTGDLATPEGQALLAEAQRAFGTGSLPPGEAPPGESPDDTAPLLMGAAALGVLAAGVVLVGGVVLVDRRRRRPR
jgi:hypothetical protein